MHQRRFLRFVLEVIVVVHIILFAAFELRLAVHFFQTIL